MKKLVISSFIVVSAVVFASAIFASSIEYLARFEAQLSQEGKQCMIQEIVPDLCAQIESEFPEAVGKCNASMVSGRIVGGIDLVPYDSDGDGSKESVMVGIQLRLPANVVVDLP